MEVLTIESKTFQSMVDMFASVVELAKAEKMSSLKSTIELLTAKEVAKLTKYSVDTILDHKDEIGYHSVGKRIMFKPDDVKGWIDRNYKRASHSIK